MTFWTKTAVIEACRSVVNSAEFVHLAAEEEFERVATELLAGSFDPFKAWKASALNPQDPADSMTIEWIFVCDLLNFSFWSDDADVDRYRIDGYSGYWALPAALNRSKSQLIDAKRYSELSWSEFQEAFKSETSNQLPLLRERYELLVDAGKVLVSKYAGRFKNFLNQNTAGSVWAFINVLCQEFPSFLDVAGGIPFFKRAQILVADLYAGTQGKYFSEDISDLTIFADYR